MYGNSYWPSFLNICRDQAGVQQKLVGRTGKKILKDSARVSESPIVWPGSVMRNKAISSATILLAVAGTLALRATLSYQFRNVIVDKSFAHVPVKTNNSSMITKMLMTKLLPFSGAPAANVSQSYTILPNITKPNATTSLPIVYVYFSNSLAADHYQWNTIRLSLHHNNKIFLITGQSVQVPADILIEKVATEDLQPHELHTFRKLYVVTKGMTHSEPWEQQNMERFFFLHELMQRRNLSYVFYADSDVAVLTHLTLRTITKSKCQGMLSLTPSMQRNHYWSVWAGTSILPLAMLADFLKFSIASLQTRSHVPSTLFKSKFQNAPFVTDMTQWFFYVVATCDYQGASLATKWLQPNYIKLLPSSPYRWHVCDSVELNFDHMHGHHRKGYSFNMSSKQATVGSEPLLSIHFQGTTKNEISRLI